MKTYSHKTIQFILFCIILGAAILPIPCHALSFTYSFLARSGENKISPLPPDQPPVLTHGAELKIFMKPGADTYLYLFLHDAEGGLYLLFPEKIRDMDCCYTFGKPYTYPPGDEWTGFDGPGGTEQFILLASGTRLAVLEDLASTYMDSLARYWQNPGEKRMEEEMAEARHFLMDRIRKERLEHSDFTNIKEEFVIIAGEFRGADETTGTKVTAEKFYAKTVRIVHTPATGEEEDEV